MLNREDGEDDDAVVEIQDTRCTRETDAAILVEVDGDEYWIPKSQVFDDSEVYSNGHVGVLVISRWLAEAKKLV